MLNGIKQSKEYRKVADFMLVAGKKRIDVYSASAAFYILMSFIPYVLIILSTIKYLPFTRDDLLKFINEILPLDINRLVVNIIDELYSGGIGVLSISIIAAVWASAKGIYAITKGLNEINDSANEKGFVYLRLRSSFSTILLMLGMILMIIISVLGDSIIRVVRIYVTIPRSVENLVAAKDIIMLVVMFCAFMFFFCFLPSGKIRIRYQLPGAFGASLLWIVFTKVFSFYLAHSRGYSMYGSFAVILITAIWLYAGMYLMFMGALFNNVKASRKGLT